MSVQALRRESSPSSVEDQLRGTLERQRKAFLQHGPPTRAERRESLDKLLRMLLDNEDRIVAAIHEDFGNRSPDESRRVEILPSVFGIRHALRHLRSWMKPDRRLASWATWPASARVEYQPLGVVGIMAPWNYPVYLIIGPLVAAIAAGNRAMVKPSELTPKTSALLAELIGKTFPADQIAVVNGGPEVAQVFSSLPFDHLLFTGSTAVGRMVMRAASENLVPVTLELGGKSPTIIANDYPIEGQLDLLVFGKLLNAGQTCVAPDYLLVPEAKQDRIVAEIRRTVAKMLPKLADNADFTAIINERHRARLLAHVDDAREKGATLIEVNPGDESAERFGETGKLPLTLLLDVDDTMSAMQDELFGPLLPIITYRELDEAIAYVNAHPRPLAAYVFSHDRATIRRVGERIVSGALGINVTTLHVGQDNLPFGGVGPSGIGHYHAHEGFLTFSHQKAVYHQRRPHLLGLLAPPYDVGIKRKMIRMLIGS
ncbi:coniferyl aldehyde dehydrogenase [Nannocystaceae bacterium ST9]